MLLTGAEIASEVLIEQGVTDIFGYPGGAALNLYDALYDRQDRIHHHITAHEQGASHAADGYARSTGKVGVCISTSGPGATNLVTGIATAYMDSIPMIAITCNVAQSLIGKDSFQEVFITGVTMPITKYNVGIRSVNDLADTIRECFRIAKSGRKGPVLIDIPKDVLLAKCEYTPAEPIKTEMPSKPDPALIMEAAKMINAAERPVLCFGGGAISADASKQIASLIADGHIPACHTIMGTGVVSFGDEHDLGMVGMHGSLIANEAIAEADLLIAAGIRFSDRVALNTGKFAPNAKILQFDIDPSENSKNINVTSFVYGDLKDCLNELLPLIEKKERIEWFDRLNGLREKDYYPTSIPGQLRPHEIMEIIGEVVGEDAVIVTDVGQHQMWAAQYCKATRPRGFITSGGLGTMGFGYGAAIGTKFGVPEAKVIHITGDGSFHMNMNEACTSVSNDLQVITVIMDNKVLGMVHQWQNLFFNQHYMETEPGRRTDYVKVIEGFGGHGFEGDTPEHFRKALEEALTIQGPSWIRCPIDPDEFVLPMIPAGKTVEDIVVSEEDLY